jgi:hypothetical protein
MKTVKLIKIIAVLCLYLTNVMVVNSQYKSDKNLSGLENTNKLFSQNSKNKSESHKLTSLGVLSTKPEFILGAIGGGSIPLAELKGDVSTISLTNGATSAPSYFEEWGYSLGVFGKLPVGKTENIRINISLIYNRFFSSGTDSSDQVTIEPNLNIFQAGLGAEYAFTKIGNVTPFIGAEFTANIFGGSIDFIGSGSSSGISYNYNRNVRYGFWAGAGIEYFMNKSFSLIGGVKYNMANLIGKDRDETGAHDLDDEAFTLNGVSIKQKNISFINIYAGVALYIRD